MNRDWNKFIYPKSFNGFVDASNSEYDNAKIIQHFWGRISNFISLSQRAKFDSKLIDIRLLNVFSHHPHVWIQISYEQLESYFKADEPPPYDQLYIVLNVGCLSDTNSIYRCTKILEYFSTAYKISTRLLLRNVFEISEFQLTKIVKMCELVGVQRISFDDELSLFSPSGVKRFIKALYASSETDKLEFECIFIGDTVSAIDNVIAAINSGINYVHVTAGSQKKVGRCLPITLLKKQFCLNNARLNKHVLQQYIHFYQKIDIDSHSEIMPPSQILKSAINFDLVNSVNSNQSNLGLQNEILFFFDVSANDWHVKLKISVNGVTEDLGERVHHYVLLLLIREYYEQYQQELDNGGIVDPLLIGWVERDVLHKMIGDNDVQFNVKLCRARKQISIAADKLGVINYEPLLTRQGALRFNCDNVIIIQGSSVEFEIRKGLLVRSKLDF